MLESILSPKTAERNPWDMIVLGFAVSSIAIWLGYYLTAVIPADPSMIALAITVMVLAPLLQRVLVIEEDREERASHRSPIGFITRHLDVIFVYSFLFVGLLASFSFWYVMLPYDSGSMPSAIGTFNLQDAAIHGVQSKTGSAISASLAISNSSEGFFGATGAVCAADQPDLQEIKRSCIPTNKRVTEDDSLQIWRGRFGKIFDNNWPVMLICLVASFLFGAGGIWLITWNASVWGVFIGTAIRTNLAAMDSFSAYCAGFPMYSLSLSLWMIPEGLSYFIAAISGGIVSVAVSRHHFKSEKFWLTLFDASILLLLAFFFVILGAYIEHFFMKVPCPNV